MIFFCHVFQYFDHFLAFHLNLGVYVFLLISAALFARRNIENVSQFYKKRLFRILIPYYLLLIIITILYSICFKNDISLNYVIQNLLCVQWITSGIPHTGHLWYITCILICYFITPLLQKISSYINKKYLIFVFLVITFLFCYTIGRILTLNLFSIFVYVLGYTVSKKYVLFQCSSNTWKMTAIVIVGLFVEIARIVFDIFKLPYLSVLGEPIKLLFAVSIICFCLLISEKIKVNCVVKFIDHYSYYFYLTHHIWVLGKLSVMSLTPNIFLNIIVAMFLTLLSGVIMDFLVMIIQKGINFNRTGEVKNG